MWSILSHLQPANNRYVENYQNTNPTKKNPAFKGITNFARDIQDIYKFEKKCKIKICLLQISENKEVGAHIHKTNINGKTATHIVNLLNFDNHFV